MPHCYAITQPRERAYLWSRSRSLPDRRVLRVQLRGLPVSFCPIQDVGYPLELGYQNFLYPSEPDLRDLLLFLVERLPTDASEDIDQPAGARVLGCGVVGAGGYGSSGELGRGKRDSIAVTSKWSGSVSCSLRFCIFGSVTVIFLILPLLCP